MNDAEMKALVKEAVMEALEESGIDYTIMTRMRNDIADIEEKVSKIKRQLGA